MNIRQGIAVILGSLAFLANMTLADQFELIVLTDQLPKDSVALSNDDQATANASRNKHRQEQERVRDAARQKSLVMLKKTIADMETFGKSVTKGSELHAYNGYKDRAAGGSQPIEQIQFGYHPTNLDHPSLMTSSLVGVIAQQESDGYVHEVAYVFDVEALGTVVIEELSYSTIPDVRITVTKPVGNMTINGFPATYVALTNQTGDKGLTSITFITERKMFTVTALKCVTRDDPELLQRLMSIANALS
jgi:hypothetical protein